MSTKIVVTLDDIARGEMAKEANDTSRCGNCPVALAAQRDWHDDAKVGAQYLGRFGQIGIARDLPLKARVFIRAFDRSEPVQPFSFWI